MLDPSGVTHIDIPAPLSKVWDTLELSISSHKIKYLLLPVQVVGVVGIKIHIEIAHEYRGILIGWILIKSILNMSVEVIHSLLAWK